MNSTAQFTYMLSNLNYTPNMIHIIIGIIVGIVLIIAIRMGFLYGYGFMLMRKDHADIERKKKTLGDLILMKDIQTELEKEIELAMLKATFHG
jgi:hypothetical protein